MATTKRDTDPVANKLRQMGFTKTRTSKLAEAAEAAWKAVVPLDERNLQRARKSEVGNAFLILAEFFGRFDGAGTRQDFGARAMVPADDE